MASTTPRQATANTTTVRAAKPAATKTEPLHPFWKVARALGSIQMALTFGSIFTLSMIIGTCLESWYSDKIAQELIYHTWWFTGLLGLLAVCIFFAAMKKWPWKKHQTGFLITHVALLTLLAGGVLNSFLGVDAMMRLVDSPIASEQLGAPQKSNEIEMTNHLMMTLHRQRPDADGKMSWSAKDVEINPGPLPWGSKLGKSIPVPGLINTLAMFANPFSRSINAKLYDDVRLEVLAYLPHCRVEPLETANAKEFGFPALKVEINTKETNRIKPAWLVLEADRKQKLFPYLSNALRANMLVELIGTCHPSLVDEFLKPPSDQERGAKGMLVFSLAGAKTRINVASELGKTIPLGNTGWKVKVESYAPHPNNNNDGDEEPDYPYVLCDVIAPDGKIIKYNAAGRVIAYPGPLDHLSTHTPELEEGLPAVWYHAPDVRYGYDGMKQGGLRVKSLLQFVQDYDGKLYYRDYLEENGKMKLEESGPAPATGVEQKIWETHAGNFIIEEYLPHAKPCLQRVVPIAKRPGLLDEESPPSVLCRLTMTEKDAQGKPVSFSKEQWVSLRKPAQFDMNGQVEGITFREPFVVSFDFKKERLGFSLELTRAESQLDPGTNRAATYTSFVKLFDERRDIFGDNYMITMNEPLDYLGYKVYQSRFENFGIDDETGKQLAGSVFTIGRDPGLWLKYLGTGMLGLGIATMFYMKAYFFKPKARKVVA
jgi:hypothetical protein